MPATYKSTQRWRTKARIWATEYAGGKCQSCNYNKYIGNLVFHHLHDKTETLSRLINGTASWERIMSEIDKCVLVCHNCHGEIHAELLECPTIDLKQRAESLAKLESTRPIPKSATMHQCICGKMTSLSNKYCSQKCHHSKLERTVWPDNLPELVQQSSKRAVAAILGVSDKAVAKRLLQHFRAPNPTRTGI